MTDTPHRPRLLTEAFRRVGEAEIAEVAADEAGKEVEEGIRQTADDEHKRRTADAERKQSLGQRGEARRDACMVVSRAMARRAPLTADAWTVDDADTVWAIADLLLLCHRPSSD